MFTGIVTDVGRVATVTPMNEGVRLRIETAYDPGDDRHGGRRSAAPAPA